MATNELRTQRAKLAEQARKILDEARASDKQAMSAEQEQSFNKIHDDIDKLKVEIDREERQEKLEAELNAPVESRIGKQNVPFKGIEHAEKKNDEERNAAFARYLRTGNTNGIEFRTALDTTTSLTGISGAGALVPMGFYTQIVDVLKSYVGVRQAPCTFITTDIGNDFPVPVGDDTANTGALIAENGQIAGADGSINPAFSQAMLKSWMFTSQIVPLPLQFVQDALNGEQYIINHLAMRIARAQNTYFTTGTGTSQPQGVLTGAANSTVVTAATGAFTYPEMLALEHSVDPMYRNNKDQCAFMFNDLTLRDLKSVTDTLGRPLWQAGIAGGAPDTFDGYKFAVNQAMANQGASAKPILFGNFSYVFVRDVVGATVLRLSERYADLGQVGYVAFLRSDCRLTVSGAVKYLSNHA